VADAGAEMHTDLGLPVTVTVVLTGFTPAVILWWERQEKKVAIPLVAQMMAHAGVQQQQKAV